MTVQHPPLPPSGEPLTLSDWAALSEDTGRRVELQEGVLHMSPRPRLKHQVSQARIVGALNAQVPDGLLAVTEIDVVIDRSDCPTVRVPHYWILHDDHSLTTLTLGSDGRYAEAAPRAIGTFRTDEPFPVEIDLRAL